jgi:hypothetical protein
MERLSRNISNPSFRTSSTRVDEIRNPGKSGENQIILDPGSHPASRDLAGMTNYSTLSERGRKGLSCFNNERIPWHLPLQRGAGGMKIALSLRDEGNGFVRMAVVNNGYRGCSQTQQSSNVLISRAYFRFFPLFYPSNCSQWHQLRIAFETTSKNQDPPKKRKTQ